MKTFLEQQAQTYDFGYGIYRITDGAAYVDDKSPHSRFAVLSAEEEQTLRQFHSRKRKLEFIAGRLAAKQAFCRWFDCTVYHPADISIQRRPNGVPFIAEHPDCIISISHSFEYAIALLARRRIGLDIEKIETRSPALVSYFCHPAEKFVYDRSESARYKDELVTRWWTRKEAISKYTMLGSRMNFRDINTTVDVYEYEQPPTTIHLISNVSDGYAMSIAV